MSYRKLAGKSTRKMANQRRKSALWVAIIGLMIVFIAALFVLNAKTLGISGIGILALLVFMRIFGNFIEIQVDRKLRLEKRAVRGARAEEKVGELLSELPVEEYYVLNDIESPCGNIDHIIIGKHCGIFLLETKAHGGKVETFGETLLVNGKLPEKDFVSQALRNAYWLRDKIHETIGSKPWVTPVIVFTNAFVPPTKPIKGVHIVNKKYLLPLLRRVNRPSTILMQIWERKEEIESKLL